MLKFTLKQYNVIALLALGFNSLTQAVPTLQLDIGGGYYNLADETVETFDNMFSVYAYATPGNTVTESSILAETYYLSIAVTPQLASASDLGTIYVNGTAINVTADMFYGNPPLDVTASNLDLPSHDIFDTYYAEI
ncbi:MAG: choice-of-anchor N protein, partial [Gammaproteobacteria bacterium]|nr:choice-of-anchor N protein [Gammaproteobacteria bacterium]